MTARRTNSSCAGVSVTGLSAFTSDQTIVASTYTYAIAGILAGTGWQPPAPTPVR